MSKIGLSAIKNPSSVVDNITLDNAGGTSFQQIKGGALTLGTAKAFNWNGLTNNTAIDFTNIPSWVKRITVTFNAISTNGATNILVQLGTGGAPTTSGYTGYSVFSWASGVVPVSSNAGIPIFNNAATYSYFGHLIFTNVGGNAWIASGQLVTGGTQGSTISGGSITLADALNYLRVVTSNGTDVLDAGSINILYEG